MPKILIECPICKEKKTIERDDLKEEGLTTIQISKGVICKHNLLLYVDPNGMVRDKVNAKIEIDKKDMKKADKEKKEKERVKVLNDNMKDFFL